MTDIERLENEIELLKIILKNEIGILKSRMDVYVNPAEKMYQHNRDSIDKIKQEIRECKKRNYDLTLMVGKSQERLLACLEKLTKKICRDYD